jgi:hypothetical protein
MTADWRSGGGHSHLPLHHPQQHLHRGGGSLLRSLTPDADFVGGGSWLHADDTEVRGVSRQGTGSYGHNSPAKSSSVTTSSASPILPPDHFTGGGGGKPLDSLAMQNMAAQLSSLPGNQFDLLSTAQQQHPGHHHPQHLPPLPDMAAAAAAAAASSSYGNFTRFGPPRFSAPPINSSSTPAATAAYGLHQPLMSGLPQNNKGLNPYATEFSGGPRGGRGMASGPPPPLQQLHHHLHHHHNQAKVSSSNNSSFAGYGNHFGNAGGGGGGGMNNFQTSIITNQGINAYLSQLGVGGPQQQPMVDIGGLGVGLADLNLGGRTLSELTDILGGGVSGVGGSETAFPNSLLVGGEQMEPKGLFSRPIGAERRTAGPSPIGGSGGRSTSKMVDPYAVWEFPPSYMENLNAPAAAVAAHSDLTGFSGLISSLSGQTLASMESLVGGGGGHFNGGGVGLHGGGMHHGGGGLHPAMGGGGGFGMPSSASATNLTPSKQQQPDYSDWGTGSTGSAPGSANKNNHVTSGFYERGDAASVRRNIVRTFTFTFTRENVSFCFSFYCRMPTVETLPGTYSTGSDNVVDWHRFDADPI